MQGEEKLSFFCVVHVYTDQTAPTLKSKRNFWLTCSCYASKVFAKVSVLSDRSFANVSGALSWCNYRWATWSRRKSWKPIPCGEISQHTTQRTAVRHERKRPIRESTSTSWSRAKHCWTFEQDCTPDCLVYDCGKKWNFQSALMEYCFVTCE